MAIALITPRLRQVAFPLMETARPGLQTASEFQQPSCSSQDCQKHHDNVLNNVVTQNIRMKAALVHAVQHTASCSIIVVRCQHRNFVTVLKAHGICACVSVVSVISVHPVHPGAPCGCAPTCAWSSKPIRGSSFHTSYIYLI